MDMDWSIVFDGPDKRACNERALVLQSQNIPFRIVDDESGSLLLVPAMVAERAKFEIWQYEQENRPRRKLERRPLPPPQNGIPGVIAYVLVLCVVGWLAGEGAFSRDWLTSGRVDGVLLRQGEWWRAITALTLHSGLRHLLGNIAFGVFFGLVAGRLLGSGVTWLVVVIAAAAGNVLNTILLDSAHRSVGASTAVFATLGLVAGFVWRSIAGRTASGRSSADWLYWHTPARETRTPTSERTCQDLPAASAVALSSPCSRSSLVPGRCNWPAERRRRSS
jgi:hypothetical protein